MFRNKGHPLLVCKTEDTTRERETAMIINYTSQAMNDAIDIEVWDELLGGDQATRPTGAATLTDYRTSAHDKIIAYRSRRGAITTIPAPRITERDGTFYFS